MTGTASTALLCAKQIGCEKGSGRATTSKNWRPRCVLTQPNELSPLGLKNGKIKTIAIILQATRPIFDAFQ